LNHHADPDHRPWRTPESALEKSSKTAHKAFRTLPGHCGSRFASALYHVTARGNEREPIYRDGRDRRR
jgi:hypothetical protein